MAAPKRSKKQREYDLERTAEYYLQGWTQRRIADKLGVSQAQVSLDLKKMQKRWQESALVNFDEARAKELARIDELERTYWAEWHRSREARTISRTRRSARDLPGKGKEEGEDEGQTIRSAESSEIIEERLGDPRYLQGVQWCIQERIKLLGLYAPTKTQTEVSGKDGGPIQTQTRGDYSHEVKGETVDGIYDILASIGVFGPVEGGDQDETPHVV